jgi:hypothetical protein
MNRIITPLFFRFGYYDQMKMNTNYFFERPFKLEVWYKIDILLDWEKRSSALFVDNEFQILTPFFSANRDKILECQDINIVPVNTVSMYNLTPGSTSHFRDLRVCDEMCSGLPREAGT